MDSRVVSLSAQSVMMRLKEHSLSVSTASLWLTIVTLILELACTPALAGQFWHGNGQIIRGMGQGGTTELQLEIENTTVKFLSIPFENQQVEVINSSPLPKQLKGYAQTNVGIWQFEQSGRILFVTLYQEEPYRVIFYRLHPH